MHHPAMLLTYWRLQTPACTSVGAYHPTVTFDLAPSDVLYVTERCVLACR
jgi:hypothetical protein